MKTTTCLLLSAAATILFGMTAQAQSWGFTLGNGAGFYFNQHGSSGSAVRQSNCGYGGGGAGGGGYGPVYYAEAPVAYYRQPGIAYPQQGVIVRTIPYSYNTSYQISYPNRW